MGDWSKGGVTGQAWMENIHKYKEGLGSKPSGGQCVIHQESEDLFMMPLPPPPFTLMSEAQMLRCCPPKGVLMMLSYSYTGGTPQPWGTPWSRVIYARDSPRVERGTAGGTWIPWNLSFRYILFHGKRLQTMLWHHDAGVNSHQRWKQTRFRVCFHLWCELTSTMNVTEWQVSWTSCAVLTESFFSFSKKKKIFKNFLSSHR